MIHDIKYYNTSEKQVRKYKTLNISTVDVLNK